MIGLFLLFNLLEILNLWTFILNNFLLNVIFILCMIYTFVASIIVIIESKKKGFAITALVFSIIFIIVVIFGMIARLLIYVQ